VPSFFHHSGSRQQGLCHHIKLIVTLTMNPAIDRTIAVDRLAFRRPRLHPLQQGFPRRTGHQRCLRDSTPSAGRLWLSCPQAENRGGPVLKATCTIAVFRSPPSPSATKIRRNFTIYGSPWPHRKKLNETGGPVSTGRARGSWKPFCGNRSFQPLTWLMFVRQPAARRSPAGFYSALIARAQGLRMSRPFSTRTAESLAQVIEAGPTVLTPNQTGGPSAC